MLGEKVVYATISPQFPYCDTSTQMQCYLPLWLPMGSPSHDGDVAVSVFDVD